MSLKIRDDNWIIFKDARVLSFSNHSLKDCSIIVKDGYISDILSRDEDLADHVQLSDYTVINCKNRLVIPGFVDPHTHPVFHGDRAFELSLKIDGLSYLEIQQRGGGINHTVSKTRQADKDTLKSNLMKIATTMMRNGTTTMEAKTGYHLTVEGELLALEVIKEVNDEHPVDIVPTFLGAHLIPTEYQSCPNEYVDLIMDEMLPKVAKQGIAKFTDVFCDSGAFSLDQAIQILERSLELNLPVRVHAEQFSRTGISKIAAERFGANSADHLLQATLEDLKSLARNDTTAIIIPNDTIVLFSKQMPPYQIFKQHDGPMAIASDFNPNNWLTNVALAIYFACYLWRIPPTRAIECATKHAAHSLKLHDRGDIQVGKVADVLVLDVPSPEHVAYRCGQVTPELVMKNGKIVHQRNASNDGHCH